MDCKNAKEFTKVAANRVRSFDERCGYVVFFGCAIDYPTGGADIRSFLVVKRTVHDADKGVVGERISYPTGVFG